MKEGASKDISFGLKKSFLWVGIIFFIVIAGNIFGYISLRKVDAQLAKNKQIAELIQYRELALTQFILASSNSAIGLATHNWDLLLSERKIIEEQSIQFEQLGKKIQELNIKGKGNVGPWFFESLKKIDMEWLDIKRQNVAILRTKDSDLVNNEALPTFIYSTKKIQQTFNQFHDSFTLMKTSETEKADNIIRQISYLNVGFQLCTIPLLIFFIFIPSLKRARELEALRSNQVSLSKLSSLGEMAGGIAHEINNPLATIMILSSQMSELLVEEPLEKNTLIKMSAIIEKTSERIAKIVQGLRTFSRDGSKDQFQQVNVKYVIEETVNLCRARFKSHEIELKVENLNSDIFFEGRETEISQVLLNLLNNAHDAIMGKKEKWVTVSVTEKNEWIEITVTDCGPGISLELQQKIFQPFFTTKDIGKGTGLGLSISDGIIKNHKGELKIDSNSPNTCFVIRLPKKMSITIA